MLLPRKMLYTVKILVPIILLSIIFYKIDIEKLGQNLLNVSLAYCFAGMMTGYVSQVFLAALRWKLMLIIVCQIRVSYVQLLKYLWIGMLLGHFVPARIGSDIYRIAEVAQHGGGYLGNTIAILGEKFFSILTCLLLLVCTYPLIQPSLRTCSPKVVESMSYVYWLGCAGTVCLILGMIFVRTEWGKGLLSCIEKAFTSQIGRIMERLKQSRGIKCGTVSFTALMNSFLHCKTFLVLTMLTVMIRVVTAIGFTFFFYAMQINLPLIVNIFVTTLSFIIFLLPISFGSLGIREGTFILLYGLFGIESEIALSVSFLALFSLLLNICIGGVIMLISNMRLNTSHSLFSRSSD